MATEISSIIKEKAPLILKEIKKATSILLHCHPSPDPDSIGSALAMKFAVESLGKSVTVIKGDSDIPGSFMHFPGAKDIVMKNFWEIDPNEYDLFIVVDSALGGVSRIKPAVIPESMRVVNIDHHRTNAGDGDIFIVDPTYPATAQLIFDLLHVMGIELTPNIALNLFLGMYSDTGGFKYEGTTPRTFETAAELAGIAPGFVKAISIMENGNTLDDLRYHGIALSSIDTFFDGKVALSLVPHSAIVSGKIPLVSVSAGDISSILRTAGKFDIVGVLVEARPGQVRMSFRTRDADTFDVSKLASSLGGGGHRAASGAVASMPFDEAKSLVIKQIEELFYS